MNVNRKRQEKEIMTLKSETGEFVKYLNPTFFIDSDNPDIIACARRVAGKDTDTRQTAINLFYHVRDTFAYNPYKISYTPDGFRASTTLKNGYGYCITKAVLLAALGRAVGIPSRLGFADVRNHLTSPKLLELMQTDVFVWHGYTEFYLGDAWVKATPAFDASLCAKAHVKTLEFDGTYDSIFHEFDCTGKKHMEYLNNRGDFADVPFNLIMTSYKKHYPMFEELIGSGPEVDIGGNFRDEAVGGSQ